MLLKGEFAIEAISHDGRGITRHNGKVIFLENAIPGEIASEIIIEKRKKHFEEGVCLKHSLTSRERVPPLCKHFLVCGGCQFQHVRYHHQLHLKKEMIIDIFKKIGKIADPPVEDVTPSPQIFHYRNRMDLSVDALLNVGLHPRGSFHSVFQMDECFIGPPLMLPILTALKECLASILEGYDARKHTGNWRGILLRTDDRALHLAIILKNPPADQIKKHLEDFASSHPEIGFCGIIHNPKLNDSLLDVQLIPIKGDPILQKTLNKISYRYHFLSFFQVNYSTAELLLNEVTGIIRDLNPREVLDLYCGCGFFSLACAAEGLSVTGMDIDPFAIQMAEENAKANSIQNVKFILAPSEKAINILPDSSFKCVILDPPRTGISKQVIKFLKQRAPQYLIYVSCNPVTLARDIALLKDNYHLVKIQPVDMFPLTRHVECVTLLERKNLN